MTPWTYCKTLVPEYQDLVDLAGVINYSKRRMMMIKNEPYSNGYDDDTADVQIDHYLDQIERLSNEYVKMVENHFAEGRVA